MTTDLADKSVGQSSLDQIRSWPDVTCMTRFAALMSRRQAIWPLTASAIGLGVPAFIERTWIAICTSATLHGPVDSAGVVVAG
jgi:hypothetical protein